MTQSNEARAFMVAAVKELFEAIRADKVKFLKSGTPQTIKEIEAVRFDEAGEPVYESIGPLVRALARGFVSHMVAERENNSPVHGYLGERVSVTDEVLQECVSKKSFSSLSFELYKETVTVISVAAHAFFGDETPKDFALPRNQAICAGLLIRISKFMVAIAHLMVGLEGCGEVVMALSRSVMESATNLRFLVLKNEDRFFDQFVKFSLSPERELYDGIQKNIKQRGGDILAIEQRMMDSIDRVCKVSAVALQDVPPKFRDWGGGFRNRLEALGEGDRYAAQQGLQSHAVHGTWVDVVMRHLEVVDGGFRPDPTWMPVDSRVMLPMCMVTLAATRAYLDQFFPRVPELEPLYERIADLERRIVSVDRAHETWFSQTP